ncbi:uncharacterized, partial [Tachysurus ichikawai]
VSYCPSLLVSQSFSPVFQSSLLVSQSPSVPVSWCPSLLVSQSPGVPSPGVPVSYCPSLLVSQSFSPVFQSSLLVSQSPSVPVSWCPSLLVSQSPGVPVS